MGLAFCISSSVFSISSAAIAKAKGIHVRRRRAGCTSHPFHAHAAGLAAGLHRIWEPVAGFSWGGWGEAGARRTNCEHEQREGGFGLVVGMVCEMVLGWLG